jgi:succinate dehydrogenase / fumarate reductase cytochrome b subunit
MATTDAAAGKRRPRPLSPHLGIYKFTMTMAMSIAHRITGVGLYVGGLLLAWFLIAASTDGATFGVFSAFIKSIIGQLVLFGFTWALFHHLIGGIRHFLWDSGYGMEAPLRDQLAWATLIAGFALTIVALAIGYVV